LLYLSESWFADELGKNNSKYIKSNVIEKKIKEIISTP